MLRCHHPGLSLRRRQVLSAAHWGGRRASKPLTTLEKLDSPPHRQETPRRKAPCCVPTIEAMALKMASLSSRAERETGGKAERGGEEIPRERRRPELGL